MNNLAIWLGLAACIAGGYFAACNLALKAFSRKRLAEWLESRDRVAQFETLIQRLPRLLLLTGALRAGFTLIVLLCALYVVETSMTGWTRLVQFPVAFLAAGALVSVFIVAIPASWARYHPEQLVARSLPVLNTVLLALWPLAAVLSLVDPIVRRLTGADLVQSDEDQLTDQVLSVVEDHERGGGVDDVQKEMLEAVFELPGTAAGEIMTPRTEVKGIEIHASLSEVKEAILAFGHSRIPVYEDNLDHIQGILYAKDMIKFVGDGEPFDLRATLREAFMVPESKSVRELLAEFKARKVHLAIVLDEYGGTAGLVTIEDILEEIVGEIQDEYEMLEEPPQVEKLDDSSVKVDARLRIDDLNDAMGVSIPEDEDYDTVGGFCFSTLGHIPEQGETFDFHGVRFTVTDAERTKIKTVKVERLEPHNTPLQPANGNGGTAA